MIDSLLKLLPAARRRRAWRDYGLKERGYAVATLHRPANVDDERTLGRLVDSLRQISREIPLVFPVHPRTRRRLRGLRSENGLTLAPPLGYLEFQSLMSHSRLAITDSGGIQEETTALGIPCLTLRDTTERPVTVEMGTNTLIGADLERLRSSVSEILAGRYKRGARPPLWDGKAAQRIAAILAE
jgi:UDP-N-acetylglucosamine 2-epimerase (non-hydrolysing)